MNSAQYHDPVIAHIIKLLEERGPRELVGRYGYGDPGAISKSMLDRPRCYLSFENQKIIDSAMGEIQSNMTLLINIVHDMTRDFGQGDNAWSHMRVAELMCGRNSDFTLRNDTIVGALRKKEDISLDGGQLYIDIGGFSEIEFGALNREKGLITSEAVLRIEITHQEVAS